MVHRSVRSSWPERVAASCLGLLFAVASPGCASQRTSDNSRWLPEVDDDRDGVHNIFDRCPTEPGTRDTGCPLADAAARDDVAEASTTSACRGGAGRCDVDGDGVADEQDACPEIPGAAPSGCPDGDGDGDGDGLPDDQDACPRIPGAAANRGCPEPDSDGDGVVDAEDRCPQQPGNDPRGQGCDYRPPVVIAPASRPATSPAGPQWVRPIPFPSRSFKMSAASEAIAEDLVVMMREYPTMRVELSGHSDGSGDRERSYAASCKRADAVVDFLVERGIDPARVQRRCAGPDEPIASNQTSKGRAQNRRVEVMILR